MTTIDWLEAPNTDARPSQEQLYITAIHEAGHAWAYLVHLRRPILYITVWFAEHGVTVQRVLTDNGGAYRSHLWRDTCTELGITGKRTRPYRPQTNGKIERFHRTLVIHAECKSDGSTRCRLMWGSGMAFEAEDSGAVSGWRRLVRSRGMGDPRLCLRQHRGLGVRLGLFR